MPWKPKPRSASRRRKLNSKRPRRDAVKRARRLKRFVVARRSTKPRSGTNAIAWPKSNGTARKPKRTARPPKRRVPTKRKRRGCATTSTKRKLRRKTAPSGLKPPKRSSKKPGVLRTKRTGVFRTPCGSQSQGVAPFGPSGSTGGSRATGRLSEWLELGVSREFPPFWTKPSWRRALSRRSKPCWGRACARCSCGTFGQLQGLKANALPRF